MLGRGLEFKQLHHSIGQIVVAQSGRHFIAPPAEEISGPGIQIAGLAMAILAVQEVGVVDFGFCNVFVSSKALEGVNGSTSAAAGSRVVAQIHVNVNHDAIDTRPHDRVTLQSASGLGVSISGLTILGSHDIGPAQGPPGSTQQDASVWLCLFHEACGEIKSICGRGLHPSAYKLVAGLGKGTLGDTGYFTSIDKPFRRGYLSFV
jgi:hypothetical protein